MNLEEIISKLKEAFEKDDVKKAVLKPEWYKKNIDSGIHSTGFCYAASEVIWRLSGESEVWKKGIISEKKWVNYGGHCFLVNKNTGKRLDITDDQYLKREVKIPYNIERLGGGFRPVKPKSKARILALMAGLEDILINEDE